MHPQPGDWHRNLLRCSYRRRAAAPSCTALRPANPYAERYERRSVMVTSNLVFSQWDRIFRDQMATAAAIDRLVHHAVVLEFDVPSFRTDPSRPTSPPSPPPVPRGRPPGPLLPRRRRPASS